MERSSSTTGLDSVQFTMDLVFDNVKDGVPTTPAKSNRSLKSKPPTCHCVAISQPFSVYCPPAKSSGPRSPDARALSLRVPTCRDVAISQPFSVYSLLSTDYWLLSTGYFVIWLLAFELGRCLLSPDY
jgi:hypothetical protein